MFVSSVEYIVGYVGMKFLVYTPICMKISLQTELFFLPFFTQTNLNDFQYN